jgi:hypothetical protein
VLSPVTKVLLVDAVPRAHVEPSLCTDQGQVFIDCDATVIEEHMMVGTQAENIVGCVGSVVGCSSASRSA